MSGRLMLRALMHIESTTALCQGLHDTSLSGGYCCTAGLLQTLSYVFPDLLGATKGGTFNGAGQFARRDLCPHREVDLQAIASQRYLYHGLTRLLDAAHFHPRWCAEAHEVC